jgi:hypothetical protein
MYLRICAGDNGAFMDAAGQFVLQVATELAGKDQTVDKNNLLLHCIVCGRLNLFVQVVSNWEETLRYYWSGWRQQSRIAEELIWVVKKELERYPSIAIPLLPEHIIALLRSLNWKAELQNMDPLHHAQLAAKFAEAALQDAADTFVNTLHLGLDEGTAQLNKLGATADQVAKAFAVIDQTPNAIRNALQANGLPDALISQAIQRAFPGIPHVDTSAIPHIDVAAKPHVDVAAGHADRGGAHTNLSSGHVDMTTGHTNTASGHTDLGGGWSHTDFGGVHGDIGGIHTDTGGVHTDFAHIDNMIPPPHVDVAPKAHIDTPVTAHVDTP